MFSRNGEVLFFLFIDYNDCKHIYIFIYSLCALPSLDCGHTGTLVFKGLYTHTHVHTFPIFLSFIITFTRKAISAHVFYVR
uniref:Uncharacterized protein n=1 Tax=Octopus bimaculoides TaxID=37653 RepID=A0A0L8GXU0_OCTBM